VKSAVVTGCSVGLGRATAEQLVRDGWRVFAGVRREADAPAGCVPLRLDVTDHAAVAQARARVEAALGGAGLDALVNNAALAASVPVEFISDADFAGQLGVNLRGPIRLIQAFLPLLRSACGRIVNVTSGITHVSQPFTALYAASKAALDQTSQALRLELAPWGIPVILVDPGLMRTRMTLSGEQAAAASLAAWPVAAVERYGEASLRSARRVTASLARAKPPEAVARVIARALEAPRPRDAYRVGADAKLAALLARLLPWRARQWLVTRAVFAGG
jgi:NAD(P)-dependent dehydrogenase (short-subunit alcohol dehydrogenase family)